VDAKQQPGLFERPARTTPGAQAITDCNQTRPRTRCRGGKDIYRTYTLAAAGQELLYSCRCACRFITNSPNTPATGTPPPPPPPHPHFALQAWWQDFHLACRMGLDGSPPRRWRVTPTTTLGMAKGMLFSLPPAGLYSYGGSIASIDRPLPRHHSASAIAATTSTSPPPPRTWTMDVFSAFGEQVRYYGWDCCAWHTRVAILR